MVYIPKSSDLKYDWQAPEPKPGIYDATVLKVTVAEDDKNPHIYTYLGIGSDPPWACHGRWLLAPSGWGGRTAAALVEGLGLAADADIDPRDLRGRRGKVELAIAEYNGKLEVKRWIVQRQSIIPTKNGMVIITNDDNEIPF